MRKTTIKHCCSSEKGLENPKFYRLLEIIKKLPKTTIKTKGKKCRIICTASEKTTRNLTSKEEKNKL